MDLSKGRVIRPVQTNYGVSYVEKILARILVMLMKESFKKHYK